jgi:hypothetical protein
MQTLIKSSKRRHRTTWKRIAQPIEDGLPADEKIDQPTEDGLPADEEIAKPIEEDSLTDEEIAQGFYTYRDLLERGFVKDRTDLKRKQDFYGFPRPTKTGVRQAPYLKARVHSYVRRRAALSNTKTET